MDKQRILKGKEVRLSLEVSVRARAWMGSLQGGKEASGSVT